jgi:hypothetical protein
MKYNFSIPASDIPVANAPELGGESRLSLSYEDFQIVAEISQPVPNSGNYVASVPLFAFDGTNGNDLALLAKTAVKSDTDVVVTFGVTFFDSSTGAATATFKKPTTAKNTSSNLPIGLAVDINGTAGNVAKKIKSIDSITAFAGGAQNTVFQVVSLPSNWFLVGCAKTKNFTPPGVPKAKAVACGLNASAFVVGGMSDPGNLDLEALHFTYGDGLSQFNGHRNSVMVERYAGARVLSERLVCGGFRAQTKNDRGDGDAEAMDKSSGICEVFAVFV